MANISKETKALLINKLTENLAVFRAKLGISQTELGEKVDIARNTVANIENGKRHMTWTMFVALSFIFISNEQTKIMMELFEIYTDELKAFLLFDK